MDMMSVASGLAGLVLGILIMFVIAKAGLNKNQQKADLLLKEAASKADTVVKQAVLDGRTQAHELKIAAEKEIKERKTEVTDMENKLLRREDNLNVRDETLTSKEKELDVKSAQLSEKMSKVITQRIIFQMSTNSLIATHGSSKKD